MGINAMIPIMRFSDLGTALVFGSWSSEVSLTQLTNEPPSSEQYKECQ